MRKTNAVTLPSGIVANIFDSLKYGEFIDIQKTLMKGAKMEAGDGGKPTMSSGFESSFEWQRKKLLVLVQGFLIDGVPLACDEDSLNNLDIMDARALEAEVDKVFNLEKKILKAATKS